MDDEKILIEFYNKKSSKKKRGEKKRDKKCVEKMEKIERKEGTINREEKNWWEVEKIICDKIETRKIGMREQFKIGFS